MIYSLCVRHHGVHGRRVGCVNLGGSAQLTLVFGGLLGQDVTFEGLRALDAAAGANFESLRRATFGFHLWHDNSLIYGVRCFPMEKLDNPSTTFYRGQLKHPHRDRPLAPQHFKLFFLDLG